MNSDDLFDRLVRKQASHELLASDSAVSEPVQRRVYSLFGVIKKKRHKTDESDLMAWQEEGIEIPLNLVIFGAFLQGVALPLAEDPEVRSEMLGDLGACFYAGSKLLGFRDNGMECVYLPFAVGHDDRANCLRDTPRFHIMLDSALTTAQRWASREAVVGGAQAVTFDVPWSTGDDKKLTVLEYFLSLVFAGITIVTGDEERLEQIDFEIEMRRAFGKQ